MFDPTDRDSLAATLLDDLVALMRKNDQIVEATDDDGVEDLLKGALLKRGYHSLFGETTPFREFMAWRTVEILNYDVELTDVMQPFDVHLLVAKKD